MLVVNKVDRADARIAEVVHQVEELFLDLDADEHQIDFPILYANARAGWVSTEPGVEGTNVEPLFRAIIEHVPAPSFDEDAPTQALVCNLSASPYVGRLAICRVHNGTLTKGGPVAWCRLDGTIEKAKITELYVTEALDQVPAESAGPGEIVSVAGLAEVTIGETLADPDRPVALPAITVDEPSLAMTIGINTSPLSGAGRDQADGPAAQVPPRRRAGRQRRHPGRPDGAARHVGGARARRAPAGRARRDDAAGGLRADGGQAAGRDPRDRRQGARAGGAGAVSTCPTSISAS